jgi:hypothetical protein
MLMDLGIAPTYAIEKLDVPSLVSSKVKSLFFCGSEGEEKAQLGQEKVLRE